MEYSLEKIRFLTDALKCRISFATMENISEEIPEMMYIKRELDREILFYHQNIFRKTNTISYYLNYYKTIYGFMRLRDAATYQENQLGCGERKGTFQGEECFLFGPEYKNKRRDSKDYFFSPEFEKICKQYNKLDQLPLAIIYPKTIPPENDIDYRNIIEDKSISYDIRDIINIRLRKKAFNQKIEEINTRFHFLPPEKRLENIKNTLNGILTLHKIFIDSIKRVELTNIDKKNFEILNKVFIYHIEKENVRFFHTRLNRIGMLHFHLFCVYADLTSTKKKSEKQSICFKTIDDLLFKVYKITYDPKFFSNDGSIPFSQGKKASDEPHKNECKKLFDGVYMRG